MNTITLHNLRLAKRAEYKGFEISADPTLPSHVIQRAKQIIDTHLSELDNAISQSKSNQI